MSELKTQTEYVRWCLLNRRASPLLEYVHAHVNEGKRSRVGGHLLKGAGLRAGFPDIEIPAPGTLFIEFKHGRNKLTPRQAEWRERMTESGLYVWHECRSAGEAIDVTEEWMKQC